MGDNENFGILDPKHNEYLQEAGTRILIDVCIDKINHENIALSLLNPMYDGWCSGLDMLAKIAHLKKIIEIAETKAKDIAITEISKYGRDGYINSGISITKKNGRRSYVYDSQIILDAEERVQTLKNIAKSISKSNIPVADTDTGELIFPAKIEYTKDSLIIKYENK